MSVLLIKRLISYLRQQFLRAQDQADLILLWAGLLLSAIGFIALFIYLALHRF